MSSSGKTFRFRGRTVADASRRARRALGNDTAIVSVGPGSKDTNKGVEISVAKAERVGIPSLMEFLQNGPGTSDSSRAMGALPARYRTLWQQLVTMNMRQDQATILCREAWAGDPALDTPPWQRIRTVLERDAACSAALDLSSPHVLGMAGSHRTGRTTIAVELCRMAAELLPQKVALVAADGPVDDEVEGVKYITESAPEKAAKMVAQDPSLQLIVVDMPAMSPSRADLLTIPWINAFDTLSLVPVVTADRLTDGIALVNALAESECLGWIVTHIDGIDRLGAVLSLALASCGPFGFVGRFDDEEPRLELARWESIVDQMERHIGREPGAPDQGGGGRAT